MDELVYRHLDKLDAFEKATVERICPREFDKVKRPLPTSCLVVDIKKINSGGKRATYEVKLRVDAPSVKLYADHSDWELQRALHRAFDNLKMEVEHKFKKVKSKIVNERRVRKF